VGINTADALKENEEDEEDEEGVIEEEVMELKSARLPETYLRLLRLHATHFEAISTLTRFRIKSSLPTVKFTLLAVKREKDPRMMSWEGTIAKAFACHSNDELKSDWANSKAAYDTLVRVIKLRSFSPNVPNLLKKYRSYPDNQPLPLEFEGSVHCEAALACLLTYKVRCRIRVIFHGNSRMTQ